MQQARGEPKRSAAAEGYRAPFLWRPTAATCICQKPKTGLLDHSLLNKVRNSKSIVIGDRDTDLQFAKKLGIKGLKIDENEGWSGLISHITE